MKKNKCGRKSVGFVYFDTSYIDKDKKYKRNRWRSKITINGKTYRHYVNSYEDGIKMNLDILKRMKEEKTFAL